MAGAMRKMGIYLGLVEDDERSDEAYDSDEYGSYHDDYPEYADDAASTPARRESPAVRADAAAAAAVAAPVRPSPVWADEPVIEQSASYAAQLARITTLHPRTYNEARAIGEHFRDGTPVIMNLTEMDDSDAKRLVDFAAGLTFGLRGSIDRVTNRVFLLSPQNVNVTAEDKARIAEGGFFNQS